MRQPTEAPEDGTMHRRLAAAVALSAALLLGACTNDAPQPPPPPSGGPTVPSESPSASEPTTKSASPSSTKHADLVKVQALYKTEFADETRVLKDGGAYKLPPTIRRRTTNPYQKYVLDSFRSEKKHGTRLVVGGRLLGIEMGKWSPSKVTFRSCEDYSGVKSVGRDGKPVKRKPGVRAVQKIVVVRSGQTWLIKDARATIVKDFKNAPCNGTWYS